MTFTNLHKVIRRWNSAILKLSTLLYKRDLYHLYDVKDKVGTKVFKKWEAEIALKMIIHYFSFCYQLF